MSTAATDPRLRQCDWASCKSVATAERGGYDFCATHLAEHERMAKDEEPTGEPIPQELLPPEPHRPPAPRVAPPPTPVGGGVGLLLQKAEQHSNARVRRLGEKVGNLLFELETRMRELAEQEKAKQEAASAAAARTAEIARLKAELARLQGRPARSTGPGTGVRSQNREPLECRKGCGKTCAGPQGRAGHERHCRGSIRG